MHRKINIITIIKIFTLSILPLVTILLCFFNPMRSGRYIFTIFILFCIFERLWEAFYTGGYNKEKMFYKDWTLLVTVFLYVFLIVSSLCEFYLVNRIFNVYVSVISGIIYMCALFLRFWSINSLGNQWSIHLISKYNDNSIKQLTTNGPYRYIRHPIYLGIILEQISMPLMANLFYTCLLISIFTIPLHLIRARIEEFLLTLDFGSSYKAYLNNTPGFNIFSNIHKRYTNS